MLALRGIRIYFVQKLKEKDMYISWKDFVRHDYTAQESGTVKELKNVTAPPCVHCHHWKPVSIKPSDGDGEGENDFYGMRLCHSVTQYRDFSCYTVKEAKV